MEKAKKNIVEKLNHLIAIAYDGKHGYENAVEDIKDGTMKNYFQQFAKERAWYVTQLKQEISNLGGTGERRGGPLGALHRTWMDMKSAVTSGDTNSIINACIVGEEAAIKNYKTALSEDYIQNEIHLKGILTKQLKGIENALNTIKSSIEVPVMK